MVLSTTVQVNRWHIDDMDSPAKESLIRDTLNKLAGIDELSFDLVNQELTVKHQLVDLSSIEQALDAIKMRATLLQEKGIVCTVLQVAQMDCPTEESLIRNKLEQFTGIESIEFNLVQRRLTIRHRSDDLDAILTTIRHLGFSADIVSGDLSKPAVSPTEPQTNWWPLVISGVSAALSEVVYYWIGGNHWSVVTLALLAILTGGLPTYKKGWIALKNLNLNMNALMSIAVTGAMFIGQWPEAAMVMFLFALAEVIEVKSLDRARNAIRNLMALTPKRVTLQQPDGSWQTVGAETVPIGAVIRVKPGESIALDGKMVVGRSTIDQGPITGESLPVEKVAGDMVFAGTINQAGSFEYSTTALASGSTLARIIHLVEAAQGSRAPTQRFVDRFARIYTPIVFAMALAMMVFPPIFLGGAWLEWIYRALVLLVIACPCALVISTPITIVSGLASAARKGILVKGGVYLEGGRRLTTLALDKTGTITYGKPVQTDFIPLADQGSQRVRALAASLALRSDHPVSLAVSQAAQSDAIASYEVSNFEALPGRGIKGKVEGVMYWLGNHRLVEELNFCSPELESQLDVLERQGKTAVLLCDANGAQGIFAVADTIKETSRDAIDELHSLEVTTVMLTGDNPHTAAAIARQVGVDKVHGNLLPQDKLDAIDLLLGQEEVVGMVGDGINDAPALAQADIGFAMGAAGSDAAIETADVALMDDDLRKIPLFIEISRNTATILKQNITLALGIKAVFLGLVLVGYGTMWMAVFADMGASLIVMLNGARLLRK